MARWRSWYYAKGKPKEHVELSRDSADLMAKFAALDEGERGTRQPRTNDDHWADHGPRIVCDLGLQVVGIHDLRRRLAGFVVNGANSSASET